MHSLLKKSLLIVLVTFLVSCSKPDAHDSHGNAINMSQYKGKWVLINYWATWCKPCIEEMPALNAVAKQLPKKVVVLGVSYDKLSNVEINNVAKKMKLDYAMTSSFPLSLYQQQAPGVLPVTYVINPQGKLKTILKGPQTKKAFLKSIEI